VRQWHSYLPDGHAIHVRRLADGWHVACEHGQATSSDLQTAFAAAVGLDDRHRDDRDKARLREWIEQHAEQMVRESSDE